MRAVINVAKNGESGFSSLSTQSERVLFTSGEEIEGAANGVIVATNNPEIFEGITVDKIIDILSDPTTTTITAIEVPTSIATGVQGTSSQGIFFTALISAMSHGEEVHVVQSSESNEILTNTDRAAILRSAIKLLNIEELYPNHPWETHGEESLAAAYHSISALFIKFDDLEGALECLALSDSFEDSPRSLALRGVIAKRKGETLEAVANMVSSLQQYEKRKKDESDHYLIFKPESFEDINSQLKDGLEALNRKDNENALNHFAEAVFRFDNFYKNFGIDSTN